MWTKVLAAEEFGDSTLGEFAWFVVRARDGRVFAIEQVPDEPLGEGPSPTAHPRARARGSPLPGWA
jgi:hypothetical protein